MIDFKENGFHFVDNFLARDNRKSTKPPRWAAWFGYAVAGLFAIGVLLAMTLVCLFLGYACVRVSTWIP